MSKSRDKRLAVQREDQPLSERMRAIGIHGLPVTSEGVEEWADEIAALEAENKRLEYELRVEKGWVRQYRDAYTRLKGDER